MPLDDEFDSAKAKFYADPKFAAAVSGIICFILGAIIF